MKQPWYQFHQQELTTITLLQKAIEDHNMTDQTPQQTPPPQPKPQLPPLKDIKEGWIPLNG